MSDIVSQCVADLQSHIAKAIPSLAGKAFDIYDQQVFLDTFRQLKNPGAAVIYEGMRSTGGAFGLNVDARFAIYLMAGDVYLDRVGKEDKSVITGMLDALRMELRGKIAPSNHHWVFNAEMPINLNGKQLFYVQRWATKGVLV